MIGLSPEKVLEILTSAKTEDWQALFLAARNLTERNFGRKLHFFVPLYFSNYCINDCLYCGFRRSNRFITRSDLNTYEFIQEAKFLWKEGHRTLLLVAGEHPVHSGVEKIVTYIHELRKEELPFSIMVEIGPLSTSEYRLLHKYGVKQCLLFQETYDRETYDFLHRGTKRNFDWRFEAMERARRGGIEKVGLGVLLGLTSYPQDLVELIRHAWRLKETTGAFPTTLSFPRIRPASGVSWSFKGENIVSDEEYEKIIAVTRLALPSVGIVLSTREEPTFRDHLLQLGIGITHLSAGSSTVPGGYTIERKSDSEEGQFELLDSRCLKEVIEKSASLGFKPRVSLL